MAATVGLVAAVTALLVWWSGRSDDSGHSGGDAEVVATGLEVPWGLSFLPDGQALVGERDTGRLYRVPAGGGDPVPAGTVPGVVPGGEGGLLGIAVDPLYIHDSFVYAYLTAADDNRIVRFRLDPGSPEVYDLQVVLDGIAKAGNHDGGGLAFGPDGMLYVGTGDAGDPARSQDPDSLNGKILRMDPLGNPPLEDPNPDPDSLVYSRGHRNVQGLAWDSDGRLWATEFGQDTFDEVNLIQPGGNYGWPEVEGVGDDPRFVDPKVTWSTDEASPSGLAYAGGSLWAAALRGERLWRIPVSGEQAGRPVASLEGQYGRLRTVTLAPDGSLWITTSNRDGRGDPDGGDDRILRVRPGAGPGSGSDSTP